MCQYLNPILLFVIVLSGYGAALVYANQSNEGEKVYISPVSLEPFEGLGSGAIHDFRNSMGLTGMAVDNERNSEIRYESPKIGVYFVNYAGKIMKVIGEQNREVSNNIIATLPELKVEDHIWDGKSIELECTSDSFPVIWQYAGVGNPRVHVSTYRRTKNFYNTSSYSYGATVRFSYTEYRQTGEYICYGVNNEGSVAASSSAYLFVPGKRVFVAYDETEQDSDGGKYIYADSNDPWVTLPCAPSNSSISIELYSLPSNDSKAMKIKLSKSVIYDPMEGFRLKWKGINALRNPWGSYICVPDDNHNERFDLKVSPPVSYRKARSNSAPEQIDAYGRVVDLTFIYNKESKTIECCSSGGPTNRIQPPHMQLKTCVSISDCYFATSSYPTVNTDIKDDSTMIRVNDRCLAYPLPDIDDSGVLECTTRHRTLKKHLLFAYDPEGGLVTSFSSEGTDTSKILSIGREKSGNPASSNHATYYCNANPFFFSNGIKWGFQNKGQPNIRIQNEDAFPSRPSIEVDESVVAKVYCFAPVWDSTNSWRNVTVNVENMK